MTKRTQKSSGSLAKKLYLTIVTPLIIVSSLVTWLTYRGLESNAAGLANELRIQAKTNRILPLLLTQDDASKALLIDPSQLEVFSGKKISAYDEHKTVLAELAKEATSDEIRHLIADLTKLDETTLRPIDTQILEKLFEDPVAARAKYFTDYEPLRAVYESKIRDLARLGTLGAENATKDLAQKNNLSLLQIVFALLLGVIVVAITITVLSRQVERSERNTKSLLMALNEGLFYFDRHGAIPIERSDSLTRIVPGSAEVSTLKEFVTKYSQVPESSVAACLKLLWNDDGDDFHSDFESSVSFLPKLLTLDGARIISLDYRPLYDHTNKLEKVVVVASDVTERLKNEREALIQAERVRKISRISTSIETYLNFFEEAASLFLRADAHIAAKAAVPESMVQLKRDLHTLKGSIGTFDFANLASEIHELESMLEEEGITSPKIDPHWDRIQEQWKFETTDIEDVLGLKDNVGKMTLAKAKFERINEFALKSGDRDLKSLLIDAMRAPLKELFAKYESYIDKLSERQTEKKVKISYAPDSCELTYAEVQALDPVFVHIVRNCFDHGIEDQDRRTESKKTSYGTIHLACYRQPDSALRFIIKDDGQGINGDLLAQKALANKIWSPAKAESASYQEKIE